MNRNRVGCVVLFATLLGFASADEVGYGVIATIAFPGAVSTTPFGINNSGQIVGFYSNSEDQTYPFLYSAGNYFTLPVVMTYLGAGAYGINDSGQIVGSYLFLSGFVDTAGTVVDINFPGTGHTVTQALGINNSGEIVGSYQDSTGSHGFLDVGGTFTTIDSPLGGSTLEGINNFGQIVGDSFIDTAGSFTTINYPGSSETLSFGINDSGQVVGTYTLGNINYGFVYSDGNFSTVNIPGMVSITGINNSGEIVGSNGLDGFLAVPVPAPEPNLLIPLTISLLGLLAFFRRRFGSD